MAESQKPTCLKNPVQLAVIGAAHGIRGEVRVKAFTENPMALGDYGALHTADGRTLAIAGIRPGKDALVIRFEGIADRNAAETLKGEALFVDRSNLPEQLEEDEFYHADLVGLRVLDEAGDAIGRIVAIHDFGAGDLLEVRPASGSTVMVPFTRDAVPEIDMASGTIRIDSVAAGLSSETAPGGVPEEAPSTDTGDEN